MINDSTLVVFDTDGEITSTQEYVVFWQSYEVSDSSKEVSIPQLVENNADYLKKKYLAMIYELGESKVDGKKVVDLLEIRSNFSFWWMTLLVEKCNYSKSPQIDNVIKLIAFKDWFVRKSFSNILLVSSNSKLAHSMKILADELNVGFEWKKSRCKKTSLGLLGRTINKLPNIVQAFLWLANYVISHWPLRGVGIDKWVNSKAKITFVSYLLNFDLNAATQGDFKSKYWSNLPDILTERNVESNWLHIYINNSEFPNISSARKFVDKLNCVKHGSLNHITLDSFLSFKIIKQVIQDIYHIVKVKKIFKKYRYQFNGYLWPLFEHDINASLTGAAGISNLLSFSLFEKALSVLSTQEKGVYLQENQGWEFGFIEAWRKTGHGNKLMGVPHSTVKFWDLRYYFDPRLYHSTSKCKIPLPDFVCVNGDEAKKMYINNAYPEEKIIEVEALRYLFLSHKYRYQADLSEKTLLVLGDYLNANTKRQMNLLQKASKHLNVKIKYIIKPHPACPINVDDYPELELEIKNDPISSLIEQCFLVYASCTTSAAIDAYCSGWPVITILDPKGLNFSPLRGRDDAMFVSSAIELAAILNNVGKVKMNNNQIKDYFYLDTDLPRWKKLLLTDNNQVKVEA